MLWLRWGVVIAIVAGLAVGTGWARLKNLPPEPEPCGLDLLLIGRDCAR
mgnify:CR=1 FL=1